MTLPVVLLTGFLGAGKATLLNHLLSARTDRRSPSPSTASAATAASPRFAKDPAAQAAGKPVPFVARNPEFKVDLSAIPFGARAGALTILALMSS